MLLVVSLGLSAAVLLAVAASLQQDAAQRAMLQCPATDAPARGIARTLPLVRVARRLVRSPTWVFGQLTNILGFGAQGAALHFGSVAIVQPLIATQLIFALPLGARRSRTRLRKRDWLAACAKRASE